MRINPIAILFAGLLLLLSPGDRVTAQIRGGHPAPAGGARPAQPPVARPAPNVSVPHIQAPPPVAPRPIAPPRPVAPPPVAAPRPTPPPVTNLPPARTPSGGFKPTLRPSPVPPAVAINPRQGGSVPSLGGGNRPAPRPTPGAPGPQPTPGNVGGFLGMQRPVRPVAPGVVPAPGGRPAVANRPVYVRPTNITRNTVINRRPSWVNINKTQVTSIHTHWNNAIVGPGVRPGVGLQDWGRYHPNRVAYWNNWGNTVRNRWHGFNNHANWFNYGWWGAHPHPYGGWHYSYAFGRYPSSYWWRVPAWGALTSWFTWNAPSTVWAQPIYYDYGPGGNVVYQDNQVYVGGQDVGSVGDFAQSAAELATVPPPPNEADAQKDDWMPLGTFALSSSENDAEPQRILQLAVDRNGIVSGTLYNQQTDKTVTVQGQVDKDTQRVALRFGESDTMVAETGLYNLTQTEVPLLVHLGPDKVENYLLVRLDAPPSEDGAAGPGM
jgi:hypothetical protein